MWINVINRLSQRHFGKLCGTIKRRCWQKFGGILPNFLETLGEGAGGSCLGICGRDCYKTVCEYVTSQPCKSSTSVFTPLLFLVHRPLFLPLHPPVHRHKRPAAVYAKHSEGRSLPEKMPPC